MTVHAWLFLHFVVAAMAQLRMPLFGPKKGRTAWTDFHVDQRYVDASEEFQYLGREGHLHETSHECWGKSYHQRICKFYNLLLWNDTFYYVTSEDSVMQQGLPEIPLSWVHIQFAERMRFAEDTGTAKMVPPDGLPFDYLTIPKLAVENAVVWHLTYHDNYGHLMGEHGPSLHNVLCTYMGRCSFSLRDRDVHILLPHNEDDMMAVVPPAAQEMLHCFTKYPLRQTDALIFKDRALVIKTALVGVGPTCRGFPWCRPNYGRSALPEAQVLRWKSRIMSCLRLPMQARIRPHRPKILIVVRPLSVGRGFLNLEEVINTAQAAFPEAEMGAHSLDGKPLAEQAALFSDASLVIQSHGAALGNMIFLPIGASIIDISPVNHEDKHAWVFFMAADFRVLRLNPIRIPEQRAIPMLHKLNAYKQWHQMPSEFRAKVLDTGICPSDEDIGFQFSTNVWCKFYWILKHSNMIVDVNDLTTAVKAGREFNRGLYERGDHMAHAPSRAFTVQ